MDKKFLIENEYISSKTNAVYDYKFIKLLSDVPWKEWFSHENPLRCREEFLSYYKDWIGSSKLNSINGLENFKRLDLINGTTQTFDEAYFKYANRRLRIFRGEYAYHRRIVKNYKFVEDEELKENDWVIISAPFCTTGDVHHMMYNLFPFCEKLNIPVIIDCAYFGTCYDLNLDLNYSCIESVSFSLTKGLGLGDIRSGIRFSNLNDLNPICQQNNYNHTILAAAKIGLYMMKNLTPDFIPEKYKQSQIDVCNELGIIPTKCMHLALGNEKDWKEFEIDDRYFRLGIRKLVKSRYNKEI